MKSELDPTTLRRILEVTASLSRTLDLPEILTQLVDKGTYIVGAERGTVFLYDADRDRLRQHGYTGQVDPDALDLAPGQGIAGTVFQSGTAVYCEAPYEDPRFAAEVDARTGFRTRSILAVPLKGGNQRVIGVLQFLNKRQGNFDSQDLAAMELLAVQASIIIGNAELFAETENARKEILKESTRLTAQLRGNIVGESTWTSEFIELAGRLDESPINILITGESGTGKSHVAKHLHYTSSRCRKPFISLNCAAIPDTLLESELFGIESGVATGVQKKPGKIELADKGCLFLDEIGDLSLAAQAKMLQVIQERFFFRVGGRTPIKVDVRILSATNKDLESEIKESRFRQDLYYRLNVLNIPIPPLRDRREDIPPLVKAILRKACEEHNKVIQGVDDAVLEAFMEYSWPGNVRELENELYRMVALSARDTRLTTRWLSPKFAVSGGAALPAALGGGEGLQLSGHSSIPEAVKVVEAHLIRKALDETGGQKSRAADILEISRESLRQKMKKYGIA